MIVGDENDVFSKIVLDGLIRADIKSRYEAHNIAVQGGWLTRNEVREIEDRNPLEGGDVPLEPLNMQPAGGGQDRSIGNHSLPQKSLATPPFQKLVESLKSTGQTCTIIESSCGGLISSSLMSVPGSSKVYFGGTVCRLLLICFAFNWVFDFSTSSGTFNFYRSHIIQKRVASCYVMTISIADS